MSCLALAALLLGSPVRADFANGFEAPPLVINEIEGSDPIGAADWVEFHNPKSTPIDLSLWYFTDSQPSNIYMFPGGTVVPAGGYLVIDVLSFGLGAPDAVALFDAQGQLVDHFSWFSHAAGTYARCPNGSGAIVDTPIATRGAANTCAQ